MLNKSSGRVISRGTFEDGEYQCQYDWPDDCKVQCGGSGIVFTGQKMEDTLDDPIGTLSVMVGNEVDESVGYRTAFFEAFPRSPNTFIRGEGETIELAETAAWEKYQAHSACPHPEFEKRGYNNGAGFCVECGMFSPGHYAPWCKCQYCDYPVYPNNVCEHCRLTRPECEPEGDRNVDGWVKKRGEAARWFLKQPWQCPECETFTSLMRLVSPSDYRLTEDERNRQYLLYRHAILGSSGKLHKDLIKFPASVFFECKCNKLKLITDLELRTTEVWDENDT